MPTTLSASGLAERDRPRAARRGRALNVRASAALVVARVLKDHRSLTDALAEVAGRLSDPRDRALLQELCYGVLRWFHQLEPRVSAALDRPLKRKDSDIHALLLLGLYQLGHLRVAGHAAVSETVEAARQLGKPWAVGLVNGVLRRLQSAEAAGAPPPDRGEAFHYSHPSWLLERLRTAWPEQWQCMAEVNNARPPMTLRVNRRRTDRADYLRRLEGAGIAARVAEHAPEGIVLDKPRDTATLPGFAEGLVSVQDAAAQLAARLLDVGPGQRVLDACAAPGGKTCHLLEIAPDLGSVTAVDMEPRRLALVGENLHRLGLEAELLVGDATRPEGGWAERRYDRILLDAPCSATGVIRRHPDIKLLRRAEDIPGLCERQAGMLAAIWSLLAPGGMLLYATCSVLPEENERQIGRFLAAHRDARECRIETEWGQARPCGRQILTGDAGMDGFYYARLLKV